MASPHDPVRTRLDQLLADFGGRVRGLIAARGLDRHGVDPADVEQEVRIRLWRALERDRSGAFHASYIQKIVASAVIDALRRAEVRAADLLPEDDELPPVDAGHGPVGPDRRAVDSERMQAIAGCLAVLPERRRISLSLHLQGFSLQEIVDLADLPSPEAARKLVSRGLEELKSLLREKGFGDFDD